MLWQGMLNCVIYMLFFLAKLLAHPDMKNLCLKFWGKELEIQESMQKEKPQEEFTSNTCVVQLVTKTSTVRNLTK